VRGNDKKQVPRYARFARSARDDSAGLLLKKRLDGKGFSPLDPPSLFFLESERACHPERARTRERGTCFCSGVRSITPAAAGHMY